MLGSQTRVVVLSVAIAACLLAAPSNADAQPKRLSETSARASGFKEEFAALSEDAKKKVSATLKKMFVPEEDGDSIHVDSKGRLYYADSFHDASNGAEDPNRRRTLIDVQPESYKSNGLPIYHSKPGSQNTIYLDFDGHVQPSGTGWGAFSARPFDTSGNDASFSNPIFTSAEAKEIGDIWQRIAEDYAPFDVDVTTEEPAAFTRRVCHCLITESRTTNGRNMPSSGAGGVAYLDIFNDPEFDYYSPALVYLDNLSERSDFVAEAASHEIGHNMGLNHDGTSGLDYYGGDANYKFDDWGPIMGTGYGNGVSQWSKGEYARANNKEDDLAIISGKMGYRTDDHGNTIAAATALTLDSSSDFAATGIIERNTDTDAFKVVVPAAGTLRVLAEPFTAKVHTKGHNLDIGLKLRSASGTLLRTAEPSAQLSAGFTFSITSAGTYYIFVYGTGHGTSKYSDYGSLGHYDLTGHFNAGGTGPDTTTAAATTSSSSTTSTSTSDGLFHMTGRKGKKFSFESFVKCSKVTMDFCVRHTGDGPRPKETLKFKLIKRTLTKKGKFRKKQLKFLTRRPGSSAACFTINTPVTYTTSFQIQFIGAGGWDLGYSLLDITSTDDCAVV